MSVPITCATPQTDAWAEVERALRVHQENPDLEAARILFAALAAHRLPGQPVWIMLVAPPGSAKTTLLEPLDGLPTVHLIDGLTQNTFLSGQIVGGGKSSGRSPSLLHRIGKDGIIAYPDFGTVLSMNQDRRGAILADMRRIYDGHLKKEYGTRDDPKAHEWSGRITFLVAATPEVDRHYAIFQTLGERFLMIRWARPGGIKAALRAMNQDLENAKSDIREAVHRLLQSLPQIVPTLPEVLQQKIAALAEFAARARTHVPRAGYSKEMLCLPEPEAPTRLAQQLTQLAKGSALLDSRSEVTDQDYLLVKRAAFDCLPPTRKKILLAAADGADPTAGLPVSSFHYWQEDLAMLGLLDGAKLTPLAEDLLRQAAVI